MLGHFIKRDFQSHQFHWGLLGLFSLFHIPGLIQSSEFLTILLFCCFFFSLLPINVLIGSTWRNQKMLSRAFLLNLPLKKEKLFAFIYLRLLVFAVPFIILLFVTPSLTKSIHQVLPVLIHGNLMGAVMVLASFLWLLSFILNLQLRYDHINFHLDRTERLKRWPLILLGGLIEFAWIAAIISFPGQMALPYFIQLTLLLVLFGLKYRTGLKLWIYPRN